MAVDIGTLYHTGWNSLRIGMCYSNFGPEMRFGGPDLQAGAEEAGDPRTADYRPFPDTTNPTRKAELDTVEFPLPSNFRLGVAYDLIDDANNLLTVAIDGNHPTDNSERCTSGLSIGSKIRRPFEAATSCVLGPESAKDEEGITLGFGINTNLSSTALSLDYAFADFGHLQQAHRVSLGLKF